MLFCYMCITASLVVVCTSWNPFITLQATAAAAGLTASLLTFATTAL